MYGIVYKFTHVQSGKSYIGVTTKTLEQRLKRHMDRATKERCAFQNALKKYGKDAFVGVVIDTAESEAELFQKEAEWISKENTLAPNGYNLTLGGGGITNMTPEIRAKISKTKTGVAVPKLRGQKRTAQQRANITAGMGYGKVLARNLDTNEEIILESVTDGKNYGFNPPLISAVMLGKRPHHKRFVFFKYANTEVIVESNESTTP